MNTLPAAGDNIQIKYMELELDRMRADYSHLPNTLAELEVQAEAITVVDSQSVKDVVTSLIKDARDLYKRIKGVHEPEKLPHLERGRGVDAFCFGLMSRISRGSDRKAREGFADRLNRLLTDYDMLLLAQEQERRRIAAEEEARKAKEAAEAKRKAEADAEAARLAAERARLEHTKAAKVAVAEKAEEVASTAHVEAVVTAEKAEAAYVETLAAPADIMRQRSDAGVLSTMGTEKFVEIVDRNELDLNKLRPYLAIGELEKALRKYAESVAYSEDDSVQIAGARFGKRAKSRVY
jgi:hypothetical protein